MFNTIKQIHVAEIFATTMQHTMYVFYVAV